ncbi:Outer membrane porin protein 32 [Pandoraea captiosa]|uniref:Outer membrane porin protein 32 n=1 Tax=Pandoraea captiosa TaxID=2508302 RepID=A0A5E4ZM24_9BURK|nr:porin [Pandoraea captiosa]VVE61283.1 Outer membrane porin protein 32 [Pandoraea captiosa]
MKTRIESGGRSACARASSRCLKGTIACCMVALGSTTAKAQSGVTLFGALDAGIEYLTNAGGTSNSQFKAGSSEVIGNDIGITGSEDLGGGLKAIFRLETGFNPINGGLLQGGRLFGRSAWIGVENEHNKLIFGRVYTPLYNVIGYLDPLQGSNVGLWTMDSGFASRMDNAVRYTRTQGPLHVNVLYSLGSDSVGATLDGEPGGAGKSKEFAASVDYTTDAVMAAVVYDNIHGPMTAAQYGLGQFVPSLVPTAATMPTRAQRIAVALRYTWRDTSIFAGVRHLRTTSSTDNHDANIFWTGVTERFSPVWIGTLGLYHERVAGVDARPTLAALQTQYLLSKTTTLYANVGKVWNTKLSNMGIDTQTQTLTGAGQVGTSVGVYHVF